MSAAVLSMAAPAVHAQTEVLGATAEGGRLWFVELSGAPVADGNSLANVRNEKTAFRRAAAAARISMKERRSFDTLFNGFSVEINPGDRAKILAMGGVKAMYPVVTVQAPTPERSAGAAQDLASALAMTGANIAQNSLGLTGKGIKVGVIDTGIDIDHPAFGGGGVPGMTKFPNARIVAGYDFVGDTYDANPANPGYNPVPNPDENPDDCGGHGTHVAGIVGANGGGLKGVAPEVSLGAYRVFGCNGSSDSDVIVAAMERALADGMQVINQSLGASFQWPQYPTSQAADRLVSKGVVVVASIGNSGTSGLYAAGAPGVGKKVIGVASYDNTQATQQAFTVTPGNLAVGFGSATGAPPAPVSGSLPLARTGTTTSAADACTALPADSLAGAAALVRRGGCTFAIKAANAQAAGAAAVILYNNSPVGLTPTVAGAGINIPVVFASATSGAAIDASIQAGASSITWGTSTVTTPVATAGLISGFSSYGMAADLTLKPNIGGPGGNIFSSYPLELGSYASLSGTSMSAPHVAGGVALVLQANPKIPANAMRARLQNHADPKAWSGNPGLGFLDQVHRQGAGMLDIVGTVQAKATVEPGELSLGESETGPATRTLTIKNTGSSSATYTLGHAPALSTGPNNFTVTATTGFAAVAFSAPTVTVPANGTATVNVTITANADLLERSMYGGYLTLTPADGGSTMRVPYAGLKGDYQSVQVLTPTANGFPLLATANAAGQVTNVFPTGGTFTMVGDDFPQFLIHLDHHASRVRLEAVDAVTGKSWHRVSDDQFVARNATATGFFGFGWDGSTFAGKGKNANQQYTVPNGQYLVTVSVLKPLGDESNPAHWETWTSPTITIARP